MALRIYNTLTRSVEAFVPLDPDGNMVGMYCCGPTVHDFAHIGNFRTFVLADLFRRYLGFRGYAVRHVMNVTDVEDKIIARCQHEGIAFRDYVGQYEAAFWEDHRLLNCLAPHETPHATGHIAEILELIGKLVDGDIAYRTPDGSVFFSIERFMARGGRYGQLVNLDFENMRRGERVSADEYDKESAADFVLWKARTESDGGICWDSPWGPGRPGWHIECSAMSMKLLGPSFDVHLGGEDLIFPHHEDEIAQSEGAGCQAPGKRFVKYWLHGAHLQVEGKKMAKSLGNFFTLRDLVERGFSGREIRHLLVSAHYRETFNFTLDGLSASREALNRLDDCFSRVRELAGGKAAADPAETATLEQFAAALDDDLNVSRAWAVVFEWVRELNRLADRGDLTADRARACLATWNRISDVLGIPAPVELSAPAEILRLADERQAARRAKDFARADALRDRAAALGWLIEDTPTGPRVKKA